MKKAAANLNQAVEASPSLGAIWRGWDAIALPDVWLSGSAIAQTWWNMTSGRPAEHGLADIDSRPANWCKPPFSSSHSRPPRSAPPSWGTDLIRRCGRPA
jgi:hypothetical protein